MIQDEKNKKNVILENELVRDKEDEDMNKGIVVDGDELIEDIQNDVIEKNDVDYSTTEGQFEFRGLSFFWKPSRIQIIDKSFNSSVTMERYDLIDFLRKSDFLPQHGYKMVKIVDKNEEKFKDDE